MMLISSSLNKLTSWFKFWCLDGFTVLIFCNPTWLNMIHWISLHFNQRPLWKLKKHNFASYVGLNKALCFSFFFCFEFKVEFNNINFNVCRSTILIQTKMKQQAGNGLPWILVQISQVIREMNTAIIALPWLFFWLLKKTVIICGPELNVQTAI